MEKPIILVLDDELMIGMDLEFKLASMSRLQRPVPKPNAC